MDIWSILPTFGIFVYLVYFVGRNLEYLSRFGMLYQSKSGNLGLGGRFDEPALGRTVCNYRRKDGRLGFFAA
jgi:hypothetical protein